MDVLSDSARVGTSRGEMGSFEMSQGRPEK